MTATTERTDWLAWRRQGLGSSDAAAILGLSPWASPWSVYVDKVGLADEADEQRATEAMEFGLRAEGMVGTWFEDVTGLHLVGEQTWCTHQEHPWMRCTVDAFVVEGPFSTVADAVAVAEIKTTGDTVEEWEVEVPPYYQAQATHHAAVTGFRTVYFPTLHLAFGRPQFRVHRLDVTEHDVGYLVERERTFWEECVLGGVPPEVDGADATTAALKRMFTKADAALDAVPFDDDMAAVVRALRGVKEDLKLAEATEAYLSNKVRAALGNATEGAIAGEVAVTWRPQDDTRTDLSALREEAPELVKKHTTKTPMRVLRLVPPKKEKARGK